MPAGQVMAGNGSDEILRILFGMSEKTMYTWLTYFILPALYGSDRSVWAPLIILTQLHVPSHPLWPLPWNSWCSRAAGFSNDDSQCRVGAQAVSPCVLKLGQHGHHGSGEGDVAQPQPIYWPVNDSLQNSHTVRVKCTGALSCWNDTCYIIPLLLISGVT